MDAIYIRKSRISVYMIRSYVLNLNIAILIINITFTTGKRYLFENFSRFPHVESCFPELVVGTV